MNLIYLIKNKISNLDIHTLEVLRKSASSTMIKMGGMILGLIVSVYLGRTLGPDGLGIFNLAQQIGSIIMTFTLLGVRQVVIKEIAIGHERGDFEHIGSVMLTSYILNGIFTLFISISLYFCSEIIAIYIFKSSELTIPLSIAFLVLTPQVFSRIFSSALVGYRKIWQSNLADQTLSYLFIVIILIFLVLFNIKISVPVVSIAFAIGSTLVFIVLGIYWSSIYKQKYNSYIKVKSILRTSIPLLYVSLSVIISTSTSVILLGWLATPEDVGLYSVSYRVAMLTSFFLLITNSSLSPKIAQLYSSNKINELTKMVRQITKGLGIIGLLTTLIFIVFGKYILSIWGEKFVEAHLVLAILAIGQFVNIGTGAGGVILTMCGYEKKLRLISLLSLALNIILNFILIKLYGVIGAAIATSIAVAFENIAKVYFVKKYIKVNILK